MTISDEERAAFKRSEMERIADLHPGVKELLAAERRATVERIRERLVTNGAALEWGDIEAILDEVAK